MSVAAPALIAGRYQVRRTLGAGAQGEVYEVFDTHEGDVVALKLLTALSPGGPWGEAQILRHIADHHILPIRNADHHLGQPYLVTELAAHGALDGRLAASGNCGLDVDEVVRWTAHACHGVARAHDVGLVHNDIKPANLFLNAKHECVVADFGFASLIPPGAPAAVPQGATAETAAPEIAGTWNTCTPVATPASDVYSLGATAYWLLAGQAPVDLTGVVGGDARMAAAAASIPPRLRDLAPHVPAGIAAVIEQAIARNPAERQPTAPALAADLSSRRRLTRRWRRARRCAANVS